ncbi:recombinase family protein [Agathobacter rectalis]|uniref:recombinase family protein n=1 Tax=Agathobacter rectalis TaxID=39491 RepID=UPI0036F39C99
MNKRDFNVVGNEGTDNQELAKGIAFVKSRRAELNVVQMVENMRDQAMPNGVIINDAYCDRSMTRDYDREGLNLSVSAPLDKVDRLEDKQSKYIHEYVKNKEYMIVGTERRHGFSQNDVDRQWHQIVDKIRKKQVDGVIVANMSVITDNLIDAFIKVAQVQAAGGIIVTVDDGRLAMQLRGF